MKTLAIAAGVIGVIALSVIALAGLLAAHVGNPTEGDKP